MVQVPPITPDLLIASLATIESAISQTAPAAMNQFAISAGMPTMVTPRENAITTLLSNGKVLIAGGDDNSAYAVIAELYDPAANSFAVGPSLNSARELTANLVLLPNGKVLIAGGDDASNMLGGADLYTPWNPRRGQALRMPPAD